jgi:serine/threonine-protein kinase
MSHVSGTPPSPELNAILTDRYRIQRQLGQGGMATVYLAEDVKLGREVALKVLRPELGAVLGTERFLSEVKITARLDHPHILTLIDSGSAGGLLYYVLPYVRGESLRDLLNREQQLGVEQALAITKQVGSALDYAHRKGVVHRDIKPENILLQEGEAMLADFGIALAVQESGGSRLTETGLSLGTPHYMSPEQATGDRNVDARSDLYSLASVLFEMLVGEPPITGKTVQAVIAKLLTEPAMHVRTVRPTVPEHVDAAIARALSKVPADRFATVADFMRALDAATAASPNVTTSAAATGAASPKSRRIMITAVVAGVAAATAGAVVASGKLRAKDTSAALRDRTQLTFSGKIAAPTVSSDGKQLAYFTKECAGADCHYAIDLQDVGSTTTRRVLEGASAAYGLEWSADRRNLIMNGTIAGRYGTYVVSALGGAPRFLTPVVGSLYD